MDLCIKELIKDSKQTLSLGWLKALPKDPDWSQTHTHNEKYKLTLANSYPELINCLAIKDNFIGAGGNLKRRERTHTLMTFAFEGHTANRITLLTTFTVFKQNNLITL